MTFAGSVLWELAGEQTPPARNDQIASGICGSFLGEPPFRMAHLMLREQSQLPYAWREWGAALVSPAVGFNRLVYGGRFDDAFYDHDPVFYGRLRVGTEVATRDEAGTSTGLQRNTAELDYQLDYGLPGRAGYTCSRPFDYFRFGAIATTANGIENLAPRGLLFGTDYAVGDNYRGIWGLHESYPSPCTSGITEWSMPLFGPTPPGWGGANRQSPSHWPTAKTTGTNS